MVKVFDNTNKKTTDIVEETLKVDANGSVTFRASLGKGSGRAVSIPGDEFDTFVSLLSETASRRAALAQKAAESSNTDDSESTDSE